MKGNYNDNNKLLHFLYCPTLLLIAFYSKLAKSLLFSRKPIERKFSRMSKDNREDDVVVFTLQRHRSLHGYRAGVRAIRALPHAEPVVPGAVHGDSVRRSHSQPLPQHLHRTSQRRTGAWGGVVCETLLRLPLTSDHDQDDPLQGRVIRCHDLA